MAASGTARLFIKIDEQQVGIDVFVSGKFDGKEHLSEPNHI
jgi:hypothetical protein